MDIEKLKAEFEQSECFKRLEHVAQYTFFEFGAYIKRTDVPADIEKKCGKLITALLFSWSAWKEAKAQAVPYESCSIKSHEIIINETKSELIDGYDIAKEDEYLLESLVYRGACIGKAQAVSEGFVLVEKTKLMQIIGSAAIIEPITRGNPLMSKYKTELDFILSTVRAMIEAQEQKITELKVEWASDCFNCGHHEAIIYSTASEASTKGWFHDGDAVKCCKCGHTGEMDARGEDSDICWNENEAQEKKG